jgi:hypothetical protein
MARTVVQMPTCATAIPSDIRSLVRVAHAKHKNGLCSAITYASALSQCEMQFTVASLPITLLPSIFLLLTIGFV